MRDNFSEELLADFLSLNFTRARDLPLTRESLDLIIRTSLLHRCSHIYTVEKNSQVLLTFKSQPVDISTAERWDTRRPVAVCTPASNAIYS
jgi:hypothetical protein